MVRINWINVMIRANMYLPKEKEDTTMANGWHEGTIGIPVKDGGMKVAH